ncbi:CopG family transcriptional regulator [Geminocystis sp. GBBB08]|uniref:type II toxin-antitoxin system RelB family antitoxin n=1 Tax=Geminocystis sp. GBBB08 TaxID=2604140 RepID=UPI0027E352FD|nr:CopG family transcriptional regulator [Geminocystis sp. GBBB08]MBL1210006.1 CopG family transcriptional regulator [Geminocystis sp. GBBB08]
MVTLSLSPQVENRLSILAHELGKKEEELLQDAIISYLEDLEDIRDAEYRLNNPESYLTLDELEKSLDLKD